MHQHDQDGTIITLAAWVWFVLGTCQYTRFQCPGTHISTNFMFEWYSTGHTIMS